MKQIVHTIYEIFDKCDLENSVIIVYVIVLFYRLDIVTPLSIM